MFSISLQPGSVFHVLGFNVTNTLLTTLIVTIILVIGSLTFYFIKPKKHNILIKGIKILIFELLKLTDSVTKDRRLSKKILPLIATFFLFIMTSNLMALIPGFLGSLFIDTAEGRVSLLRSPNSDLNTTLALALFSITAIQFFSITTLGLKNYLTRFFNFAGPIAFITGFFELISEGIKILSFSFRLFGNIFAGEILLLIMAFLLPYIIPIPFIILEIFVGIVQAFIFTALTLTFIKISTIPHTNPQTTPSVIKNQ